MAKSSIAAVALSAIASVAAAQEINLVAFARANEGKFASELQQPMPETTLWRREAPTALISASFDQAKGLLVLPMGHSVFGVDVVTSCKKTGTYVGTTAFGRSATVTRQTCVTVKAEDQNGFELGLPHCTHEDRQLPVSERKCFDILSNEPQLAIPVTADQYRDIKRRGLLLKATFRIGDGVDQEVVERRDFQTSPKIDDPFETTARVLSVRGRITRVSVFTADGKTELATIDRR